MQYMCAIILAVIFSLLVVCAIIDDHAKVPTKVRDIVGRIMLASIAGLWFYMAWWGIYLN